MPVAFQVSFEGRIVDVEQLAPNRIATRLQREIQEPIGRFLQQALSQQAPPRTDVKFVWSLNRAANERARRWWFYAIREGLVSTDGSHYKRSGDMVRNWNITVSRQGNSITIDASNKSPGSEFVYGSETQNQIPGHATTGWPEVQELLLLALEFVEEQAAIIIDREINRILGG
ncbi:MAG: hypothetical protein GTO60_16720 [Gammaproteobacteria bacterium]|nr:hypothetical protein [Gammaproteobacteria bacterium]